MPERLYAFGDFELDTSTIELFGAMLQDFDEASRSASLLISSTILRLITKVTASMGKRSNATRLYQSGV
jgi:hypothetical protein